MELQNGRTIGCEIRRFDCLDSTNTYTKQAAQDGAPEGLTVVADCQTAGRGRQDRFFQSAAGKGLYLSVLLRPDLPPEQLLPVTALAGVAVCDAVERVCGVRPGLKWPNDPVLGNRKLGGILTELVVDAEQRIALVLGIGINVLQEIGDFSPEVAELATSLAMELCGPVDRVRLTETLLEELDRMYGALKAGELTAYLASYRKDCVNLGRQVRVLRGDAEEPGLAVDVDENFCLMIRWADGREEIVHSGEVSVRGLYGYVDGT